MSDRISLRRTVRMGFVLLLCIPGLCGCSREMPPGETRLPLSEITEPEAPAEEPTIPEDWMLPEQAKSCRIEVTELSGSYLFYDDHGNEILAGYPEITGDDAIRTHYTYGDDGTITYRSVQDHFGIEKERYEYNSDLTVKRCFDYLDGREQGYTAYAYDKHGQVTRETYIRLDDNSAMYEIRYQNSYDDAGNLICRKCRDLDELSTDTYYEYDAQGNVIHETLWSPYLGQIVSEERYFYDDTGVLRSAIHHSGDMTYTSWYTYVDLEQE